MGCFMMDTTEAQKGLAEVAISEIMIDEEREDSMIMTDKMDDIQNIMNIENKYGLMLFRMALTHVVDFGHRNLTDEAVEESIRRITAQGEEEKANGITSVLSPEFQCELVRCAAELARFSIWTLFAYIKMYVVVSNLKEEIKYAIHD